MQTPPVLRVSWAEFKLNISSRWGEGGGLTKSPLNVKPGSYRSNISAVHRTSYFRQGNNSDAPRSLRVARQFYYRDDDLFVKNEKTRLALNGTSAAFLRNL